MPSFVTPGFLAPAPFVSGLGTRSPMGAEVAACEEEKVPLSEGRTYADSEEESLERRAACRTQPLAMTWSESICDETMVSSGKTAPIREARVGFLQVPPARMT